MTTIRPIRESDTAGFRAALDAICRERKYLARSEAPPLESVQKFVAANVHAGHPQFVADDSEKIIGWCDALPAAQEFGRAHIRVLGMGVVRDYRGQKIGLRLIEAVIAATRRLPGVEKIELVAHASNAPALALYRKIGFEIEGVKKRGLFADGRYDDLVLMGLFLHPSQNAAAPATP